MFSFMYCTCTFTKPHYTAAMQGTSEELMHTAQIGCSNTPGETLNGPPGQRRKEGEVRPPTMLKVLRLILATHSYD
jgi:hypothetical protein